MSSTTTPRCGKPVEGRDAAKTGVIDNFLTAVPDAVWTMKGDAVVQGDRVAFEWEFSGTNTGAWGDGTAATGKKFSITGASVFYGQGRQDRHPKRLLRRARLLQAARADVRLQGSGRGSLVPGLHDRLPGNLAVLEIEGGSAEHLGPVRIGAGLGEGEAVAFGDRGVDLCVIARLQMSSQNVAMAARPRISRGLLGGLLRSMTRTTASSR